MKDQQFGVRLIGASYALLGGMGALVTGHALLLLRGDGPTNPANVVLLLVWLTLCVCGIGILAWKDSARRWVIVCSGAILGLSLAAGMMWGLRGRMQTSAVIRWALWMTWHGWIVWFLLRPSVKAQFQPKTPA